MLHSYVRSWNAARDSSSSAALTTAGGGGAADEEHAAARESKDAQTRAKNENGRDDARENAEKENAERDAAQNRETPVEIGAGSVEIRAGSVEIVAGGVGGVGGGGAATSTTKACPEHPEPHRMTLADGRVEYWLCLHHTREDIYVSLVLFDGKVFEPTKVAVYLQLLQGRTPPVTVLDLGANIGYFAVLAAALGHRTIAIEPMPHNFQLLKASAELNGFGGRMRLVNNAGGPREDMAPLVICSDPVNQGDSAVVAPGEEAQKDGRRCHTIPVVTLNKVLADEPEPPMMVKADTQGYDALIMDGDQGGAALWKTPPAVILIEWEPERIKRVSGVDAVVFLRSIYNRGYTVGARAKEGRVGRGEGERVGEWGGRVGGEWGGRKARRKGG